MRQPRIHRSDGALPDRAEPQTALLARARRARLRGEVRRALVAIREACMRDERAAPIWTLYGAWLFEAGRADEGRRALSHAVWLRRTDGDGPRAASTAQLLKRLGDGASAA